MHSNSFNQSPIIRYLDCFQFFAIISSAAVNILIHCIFAHLSRWIPWPRLLGQRLCILLVLIIYTDKLTSRKTVNFTLLLSIWVCLLFQNTPELHTVDLFYLTKLRDDKWYLIFICEVDFLSISLLAIYFYFLRVCFSWPLSIFL